MTTITVFPNGDGSVGSWTDQTFSSTNLYLAVDEPVASANDADYIRISVAGTASSVFFELTDMPSNFGSMGATIVVQIRCNASAGAFGSIAFYESDETTALTDSQTPSISASMANYTLTMNVTGSTDKTSWDGARLRLTTDTSISVSINVSAIQIDITYYANDENVAAALFM